MRTNIKSERNGIINQNSYLVRGGPKGAKGNHRIPQRSKGNQRGPERTRGTCRESEGVEGTTAKHRLESFAKLGI